MELRDALRLLRKELCMTQSELAQATGHSFVSVNRWERGKTLPNTKAARALRSLAEERGASEQCQKMLSTALTEVHVEGLDVPESPLFPVERDSICQLVDDSVNAVYVCDLETDELLYMNHRAEYYVGKVFEPGSGKKCYEVLHGRVSPCAFCPKHQMDHHDYADCHYVSPNTGRHYHFQGRKLDWNGRPAHAEYFYDETNALESQNGMMELINSVDAGICAFWVYDDGHVYMNFMSDGYFRMVDSTREERAKFSGFGVMNSVVEEDRDRVYQAAREAASEQRSFTIRYRVQLTEERTKELILRANFIRREPGKRMYYCFVLPADEV